MSEEITIPGNIGNVKISDEVVAIISGIAASEISGVAGASTSLASGVAELLGKKSFAKGVKVEIVEDTVTVSISLIMEYGSKIPDVAWEVQENIKKSVENYTGLKVLKVDVFVDGIAMQKEEAKHTDSEEK